MRIAFVVPGFSADERDPGIPVLLDVFRRLQADASIQIIALRYPEPARRYQVHGISVHALGGGMRGGLGRAPLLAAALRGLHAEHRRAPLATVHGLWADEPGAVAVAAGRLLGIPSVVSVMGGELVALAEIGYGGALSRINRLLTRFAMGQASAVTAACEGARDSIGRMLGPAASGRVYRLPWGIDPGGFTADCPRVTLQGDYRVLQVGSLVPVKGHRLLLEAAARARKTVPGIHIHVVGDGPGREDILALAARLGLGGSVTLHGPVSRERLGTYYLAADVLAVPSLHEMQPVVALEAAFCGLPVVGTAVGLLPELAPAAMTVAPGDVGGLAAALVQLAEPELREDTGAAAQELVRRLYLAENTCSQLLGLYAELVHGSRRIGSSRLPDHPNRTGILATTPSVDTTPVRAHLPGIDHD